LLFYRQIVFANAHIVIALYFVIVIYIFPTFRWFDMLKFIGGLALGITASFSYVKWGVSQPTVFELADRLKGNVVSTVTEEILYDLDKPLDARARALEVFFQNRPKFAVEIDAQFGNAFLQNLYRRRVIREARQLRIAWNAYDVLLNKPALRKAQERKYGTYDPMVLKQSLLLDALSRKTFLAQWVKKNEAPVTKENVYATVVRLGKMQ